MDVSGLDNSSLKLTVQLLREDMEVVTGTFKGKYPKGQLPDSERAFQEFESELAALESFVADRTMCMSVARAVSTDGEAIVQEQLNEDQAAADRKFALSVRSSRAATIPDNTHQTAECAAEANEVDDELLRKLRALYVDIPQEENNDQAESSSWAASRPNASSPQPTSTCISCGDQHAFYNVARCPCQHEYCRACIASLFKASIRDESLFPPRCCKRPIPLELNQVFLPSTLVGEFKAKKVELETPNRTYCHEPTCSTFVPVQFIQNNVASCVRCGSTTCTICKQASHRGDCPQDPTVQEILRVATENQWQRCYSCMRLVELEFGCNHMTCLCGAEFCYICGGLWKTCSCQQWDEHRLYARAETVVDRDFDAPFDDEERARRIRAEADNLMENHECEHQRWRSRMGRYRCEECHKRFPEYIYECRQCRIQVCRRCRFNRL